ncbi:MAG: DUF134 domain-containing protein [Lachnospiraceae bacterium]|nr:DUF134 domain-containing protein [Lachnospiraceae bacterium]
MARPRRNRRVCEAPAVDRFAPDPQHVAEGAAPGPDRAPVVLTIDEYEALRLVDHEGLTHSECAQQMNISRTTATEICESAHHKVAEALVGGRELVIEGGSFELCGGNRADCFLSSCTRARHCGGARAGDSEP